RQTPLIAAVPKALFPFLVIVPGLAAAALRLQLPTNAQGEPLYDYALPLLLKENYPVGMLGLGLTALMASFMSGMAGNVTGFNTVWTFDIYQAYLKPSASEADLFRMGKLATFWGTLASVGTAYIVMRFNSLMDYMQLLFSFFNAPIFATFLLGMFWKRTTPTGAFVGLLCGILAGVGHHVLKSLGVLHYGSDTAAAFYGAIVSWTTCFSVTVAVSSMTEPRPESELGGLVYSLTPKPRQEHHWLLRPSTAAIFVLALVLLLN